MSKMAGVSNSDYDSGTYVTSTGQPSSVSPAHWQACVGEGDGDTVMTESDVIPNAMIEGEDSSVENSTVYLSVMYNRSKLGAAYYDVDTTQIHMLQDTAETSDLAFLKRVCQQVQPSCVIVSATQGDRVIKTLENGDDGAWPVTEDYVQILPSIDFSLDICKRRLLTLSLPGIPDHFTESERTLYLSSLVPFENVNMVQAVGALIKYLDRKRIGIEMEAAETRVPVLSLEIFSLVDLMIIDQNTLCGLQIFNQESAMSKPRRHNDEPSLYGMVMDECKSRNGRNLLRLWFLQPLKSIEKLEQRQEAVAYFANHRNLEVTKQLQKSLRHVKLLPRILARMRTAEAALNDWQALYRTVYNAICIAEVCRAQPSPIAVFQQIDKTFTDALPKIANLISKIVDFDESAVLNRFVVKLGVDPELDQMKRTHNGLPELLTKVAQEELGKLSEDITTCNVVYLPTLGYLLAVPLKDGMEESDQYDIPGLKFLFHSNGMAHYRSPSTMELDHQLGDVQCDITDRETAILHRLQNTILEDTKTLLDVMKLTAELDCLAALGSVARANDYVRPRLTKDNVLQIQGGRHPLQEKCCSPFVPNNTFSGAKDGKMKIMTGPNASGKSVYLKQVALIVYLAHIGSFVPAEGAVIGITDRIFTRIKTLESVSVGLSTFMIDLTQVSAAVRLATEKSLVILDELGKGTNTVDGVSLLSACLKYWLKRGGTCPHVFVSTHFHSLVQKQLLPPSPQVKYQTMDVVQEEGGELVFLYQLKDGSINSSYACHVAAMIGTPPEIVQRADEVCELFKQNKQVHAVDADVSRQEQAKCEAIVAKFLQLDLDNDDVGGFMRELL